MNRKKEKESGKAEKQKSYGLLMIGAVLLIAGILFSVYAYNTSYRESTVTGAQLSEVKAQIGAVKEGTQEGDLEALTAQSEQLSAEKLSLERPYSYGLTLVFFAIFFVGVVIVIITITLIDIRSNAQYMRVAFDLLSLCIFGGHTGFRSPPKPFKVAPVETLYFLG